MPTNVADLICSHHADNDALDLDRAFVDQDRIVFIVGQLQSDSVALFAIELLQGGVAFFEQCDDRLAIQCGVAFFYW